MKLNPFYRKLIYLYLALTAILYIMILTAMVTRPYAVYSKIMYAAVLVNLAVVWILALGRISEEGIRMTAKDFHIPAALLMTALADYFLTLNPYGPVFGGRIRAAEGGNMEIGVICFCMVQGIYTLYLGAGRKEMLRRLILSGLLLAFLRSTAYLNLLTAAAAVDISLLGMNVYDAVKRYSEKRTLALLYFCEGMILFFGCDFSLGLRELTVTVPGLQNEAFFMVCALLTWIFYIPSQAAIVLSYASGSEGESQ